MESSEPESRGRGSATVELALHTLALVGTTFVPSSLAVRPAKVKRNPIAFCI
jgi:hypothetical protein